MLFNERASDGTQSTRDPEKTRPPWVSPLVLWCSEFYPAVKHRRRSVVQTHLITSRKIRPSFQQVHTHRIHIDDAGAFLRAGESHPM